MEVKMSVAPALSTTGSYRSLMGDGNGLGVKSWPLDKYTRLYDSRENPTSITRGKNDEMVIYVDLDSSRVYMLHNGRIIEDFFARATLHPHEVVCKDLRVLCVVRNQMDGGCMSKFRVRFSSIVSCNTFCTSLEAFNRVETYSRWKQEDGSSAMNSTVGQLPPAEDESEPATNAPMQVNTVQGVGGGGGAEKQIVVSLNFESFINEAAMDRFATMCESIFAHLSGVNLPAGKKSKAKKPRKKKKDQLAFVHPQPKKPGERFPTRYNLRGTVKKEIKS